MTPATRRAVHLMRRWWGSLSSTPPSSVDSAWVETQLSTGEKELFGNMTVADRRHAILVARRFLVSRPDASREQVAAALLHDVGKALSDLSTGRRVLATIVGPRTRRFRDYHDHERIGLEMCRRAGSNEETLSLLAGAGDPGVLEALRRADDI
ncbi:MAG: hypothetical protein LW627_10235 [Ilumatobacteraceae bacterium]|nr:hypothetical protein [Ilumatobacteraceae bacterium]